MNTSNTQNGFSLLELLVTLVVGSILVTTAVPAMSQYVANSRASEMSTEIYSALLLARSEAVNRGMPVSLCALPPSGVPECATTAETNWAHGWLVYVDNDGALGQVDGADEILHVYNPVNARAALAGSGAALSFAPTGSLASAALRLELRVDGCRSDNNRNIMVPMAGQPYVQAVACTV